MARGDRTGNTAQQTRKAEHIEEGYETRGVPHREAERRAWATVNKETGGGKKSGSGRGRPENRSASRKGDASAGGAADAPRPAARRLNARARPRRRRRRVGGAATSGPYSG